MDRSADWPWSWEEEVKWRADLEERDYDFLQELIEDAVEDSTADSRYAIGSLSEEPFENAPVEEYFITA